MVAIPGTIKPKRLEENWASRDIILTEEEQAEFRIIIDKSKSHGNRFVPAHEAVIDH